MDGYLKAGMVFDISQWGNSYQTMKWLDGETGCQGDCNLSATVQTYSDFEIGPIPSDIEFGPVPFDFGPNPFDIGNP